MLLLPAALAMLLATDPAPVPAPELAPPATAPAPDLTPAPIPVQVEPVGAPHAGAAVALAAPVRTSSLGRVRAGFGVSVTDADSGYASTFQAGVQVDPWSLIGFRGSLGMTTSVVGAGGWDAAELTGSVLFRPLGNRHRVVPYAGLGVQFALLALFPDPPRRGSGTVARLLPSGHPGPLAMMDANGDTYPDKPDLTGGTNQFKVMPELSVGALINLTSRLDLDVAGRYLPLNWNGTTYSGFSVVASLCAPF